MIKEIKEIRITAKMRYNISDIKLNRLTSIAYGLLIDGGMVGYYDTDSKSLTFNYRKFLKICELSSSMVDDYNNTPSIHELLIELLPYVDESFTNFTIKFHQ